MANNKVVLADGTTLIDLTDDSVTPETLLRNVTAHNRSGALITGVVDLARAGSSTPLPDEGSGSVGSSDDYARQDHVHPSSPAVVTATYNNNQANIYGNYLSFVSAEVAVDITLGTGKMEIPCTASNKNGWAGSSSGIGHITKLGSYIFIIAELVDGTSYTNCFDGSSWVGWKLLSPNANEANALAELSTNSGGTITSPLTGAVLSRTGMKRAGQVYTISAEISGISQDLNNVAILSFPSGFFPKQSTIIYGFFTTVAEETYTETENIISGATLADGKAIVASTGAETSRSGYTDTDYVPVENGKTYTVSPVFNGSYGFAFYKGDKTFISGLASTDENKTFVTPWNAEYVRLTVATNQKSNFKFNRIDKVSRETKIIAPILLNTDGFAYALPPANHTYTKVELAGAYGDYITLV